MGLFLLFVWLIERLFALWSILIFARLIVSFEDLLIASLGCLIVWMVGCLDVVFGCLFDSFVVCLFVSAIGWLDD